MVASSWVTLKNKDVSHEKKKLFLHSFGNYSRVFHLLLNLYYSIFYLMYPKFFDNFGTEFILHLKGLIVFLIIMLIFLFPVFILLALVRLLITNKISYLINFVLFEFYGYFLFGYPDTNYFNGSLLYVLKTQYFIYSIPMTFIFLLIVFIIDVNMGIK